MSITCPICQHPLDTPASDCPQCTAGTLPRGLTLKLRYRLDGLIGRGGFGVTYRAVDPQSGELVAIKELYPVGAVRAGRDVLPSAALRLEALHHMRDGFLAVHRAVQKLTHPNLLAILDVFEQHGTAYVVMPLLKGMTLAQRVQRRGPLLGQEAKRVASEIAAGLDFMHRSGVLHRDLKPENIYLCDDGRVVLIDFDSLRAADGTETLALTRVVSAGYAPIEQYSSEYRFTPAADLYALGASLYYAVQAEAPPPATDLVTGASLKAFSPTVDAALAAAIRSAMAVKAQDRPQSAQDFVALLTAKAPETDPAERKPVMVKAHTGAVTALALSDDGTLLTASDDNSVRWWRIAELGGPQAEIAADHHHHEAVRAASYSVGGDWVSAGEDGNVFIRRALDGHPRRLDHDEALVAMDTTAEWVAAAGTDRRVQIWTLEDGAPLGTSQALPHWPTAVHYTPQGDVLFVGLQDGRLLLLHGGSARLLAERAAHQGRVNALTRHSGQMLSAGDDGRVCWWDAQGQKEREVPVASVALVALAACHEREDALVAAASGDLYSLDGDGAPHRVVKVPGTPTALLMTRDTLVVGLADGRVYAQAHAQPPAAAN